MRKRRSEDLGRVKRRRLVLMSLLRSTATVTVTVALYYQAPLDRSLDAGTTVWLTLILLVLGGVLTWQVRAILDSPTPRLRAGEVVPIGLATLLLSYASTYVLISEHHAGSFTENLGRTDALYYTVTVFATVGFGDIAPKSEMARVVTMTQMLVGLVAVGVIAKIVLGAVQVAVQRRAEEVVADPSAASAPAPGPGPSDG
ncbi:potassium channel family protein [Pseudonocardia sp.]|jgi:voltage-gated potassium channel|uniref:potassium channel family protein n=1 Tax=Pseudonocardia sp. TaxID=60912 RepID=UPI0026346AB2|nr:potassium channel family protein [Pseudonocardia sp.]MCW2722901.1 Ion transport 2 domain protein [Pseudonocardia sp.]MDT7613686.1 voltage-gated potassium channel [Pseudonocardiales bacterium]